VNSKLKIDHMKTSRISRTFFSFVPDSRGVALIMVLWVVAILSVVALEFCFAMRTEVYITQNYKEEGL